VWNESRGLSVIPSPPNPTDGAKTSSSNRIRIRKLILSHLVTRIANSYCNLRHQESRRRKEEGIKRTRPHSKKSISIISTNTTATKRPTTQDKIIQHSASNIMPRRFGKEDDEVLDALQEPSLMKPSISRDAADDANSTVVSSQASTMTATTGTGTGTARTTSSSGSRRASGEDPSPPAYDADKQTTRKTTSMMGLQHAPGSHAEEQQVNKKNKPSKQSAASSTNTNRDQRPPSGSTATSPSSSPGVVSIPGLVVSGGAGGGSRSPSSTKKDATVRTHPSNRLELAPGDHASINSSVEAEASSSSHRQQRTLMPTNSGSMGIQENERSDESSLLFPGVVRVGNHDDSALRDSLTTQGPLPSLLDPIITAEVVPNTNDVEQENELLRQEREELREELRRKQGEAVVVAAKVVVNGDNGDGVSFFSRWWKCIAVALLLLVGGAVGVAVALSSNNGNDDGPSSTSATTSNETSLAEEQQPFPSPTPTAAPTNPTMGFENSTAAEPWPGESSNPTTTSAAPTTISTISPTTPWPSQSPSQVPSPKPSTPQPIITNAPTRGPSTRAPTRAPTTTSPTPQPTPPPTTPRPTPQPTPLPTPKPTFQPTPLPTPLPTPQPTPLPTPPPTPRPTRPPTPQPTPAPQNPLLFRSARDTSQCLTISSSNPNNFDLVYPDTCGQGSSINQEFVFSNGYWMLNSDTDWCIEGDSDFQGEEIFVYQPCIDRWTYQNDCTIKNNGEGTCLTWSGLNSLTLETCQGLAEQKWLSSSESACTFQQ
jgi:hypothetical protein